MSSVASRAKRIEKRNVRVQEITALARITNDLGVNQIAKKRTLAGLTVLVRRHVHGSGNQQDVLWYIRKLMNY